MCPFRNKRNHYEIDKRLTFYFLFLSLSLSLFALRNSERICTSAILSLPFVQPCRYNLSVDVIRLIGK